jgi:hypothetical protein
MKKIITIACFLMILFSCKKEIIEIPESNSPVFSVTGTIGEEKINFIVGDDNSIFSYQNDEINSIKFFKGLLINDETQIELGFFNGQNESPSFNVNQFIANSNFKFAELPFEPIFELKKENLMNSTSIKEIKWYVNDSYFGTNNLAIYEPGKYNICAKIFYVNQSQTEICNELLLGFERKHEVKLDFNFENNNLNCWVDGSNSEISSINWYLDGEEISNSMILNTSLNEELHKITAEIKFSNGTKKVRNIAIDGSNLNRSINDFGTFESNCKLIWDYNLKLNVKINNQEYISNLLDNQIGSFEIDKIEFLGKDKNNIPVYVFKGNLKSKIKSKATNEILDVDLDISWGLGLK